MPLFLQCGNISVRTYRSARILLLTALIGINTTTQAANTTAAKELFELSLEELIRIPVAVATRAPQQLQLIPASVTVYSREDIERMGVRWLDELLRYVPGAYVHQRAGSAAGFWTAQFRGNPNENGSGVLLLIDGRRQNDAVFGTIATAWMRQSLAGFERVEIMRSPASALYGANATYAVINLISGQHERALAIAGGEKSARDISASAPVNIGEWRLSGQAHHYEDEGDRRPAFDRFDTQHETQDAQRASSARLSLQNDNIEIFTNVFRHQLDNFYVLATLADGTNHTITEMTEYGLQFRELQWQSLNFDIMLNHRESEYELFSRQLPAGEAPAFSTADFLFRPNFQSETNTAELTTYGSFNPDHHWQIGTEAYEEQAIAITDATHDILTLDYLGGGLQRQPYDLMPNAERTGYGLYLQWQAQWADSLATYLGVRRDDTDDIGNATSPRAAVTYTGFDHQTWKLAYVEAFRAPSVGELHLTANRNNLGNEALTPVLLRTLELMNILQYQTITLETSLYQSWEKDRILFAPDGPSTVKRFNMGELDTQGLELALRWRAADTLELGLLGSHIIDWQEDNANAVRQDDVDRILPRNVFTTTVDWFHQRWQLHLAAHYISNVNVITSTTPYTLGRLRLGYQWTPDQTIALTGSNFADIDYDTVTDSVGLGVDASGQVVRGAPQRGRQLLLSWEWR